jgi:hypothetical protein
MTLIPTDLNASYSPTTHTFDTARWAASFVGGSTNGGGEASIAWTVNVTSREVQGGYIPAGLTIAGDNMEEARETD